MARVLPLDTKTRRGGGGPKEKADGQETNAGRGAISCLRAIVIH